MPPKRATMVQELRECYTEEYSLAEIREWSTRIIKEIDALTDKASELQGEIEKLVPATAYRAEVLQQPAVRIMPLLREYQALCRAVFNSAEKVRLVIMIRVPEHKEEDNLGVAVQQAVLRALDALQNRMVKGSNASSEKETSSASSAAGMFLLRDYLGARVKVEAAILNGGAPSDEEQATRGKAVAPSSYTELQQLDIDTLYKVELASRQLSTAVKAFINTYVVNWKKLIDPRNGANDRMVA
ncbi:proteasome activator protein PA26 [Strigomonas culicis]|uniref:Proteasome activator protein PA26 n=2 Tax=Strigomonas culicis TaxID=28005 RepID=S9WDI9_9TRYP|nr:proteasome activator protein PA26 [Strigomonas culicis]|eukprot:EPY37191.1 proteasome activator protein PA26 [Strigomonas culicis]